MTRGNVFVRSPPIFSEAMTFFLLSGDHGVEFFGNKLLQKQSNKILDIHGYVDRTQYEDS